MPMRPVWDVAQRVAHWTLASAFGAAWLTSESEAWRLWHGRAGLVAVGVAIFRLLWGWVGTRHAQFGDFLAGPDAVVAYGRSVMRGRAEHYLGHNPAGGWAVVMLLTLTLTTGLSGWMTYNEWGGEVLAEAHELLATGWMVMVAVHVAGVITGSLAHRENLVLAMVTGRKPDPKPGTLAQQIRPGWAPDNTQANVLGIVVLLIVVAAVLWWGAG
jgi:cytochrome b